MSDYTKGNDPLPYPFKGDRYKPENYLDRCEKTYKDAYKFGATDGWEAGFIAGRKHQGHIATRAACKALYNYDIEGEDD